MDRETEGERERERVTERKNRARTFLSVVAPALRGRSCAYVYLVASQNHDQVDFDGRRTS